MQPFIQSLCFTLFFTFYPTVHMVKKNVGNKKGCVKRERERESEEKFLGKIMKPLKTFKKMRNGILYSLGNFGESTNWMLLFFLL